MKIDLAEIERELGEIGKWTFTQEEVWPGHKFGKCIVRYDVGPTGEVKFVQFPFEDFAAWFTKSPSRIRALLDMIVEERKAALMLDCSIVNSQDGFCPHGDEYHLAEAREQLFGRKP